MDPLHLYVVCIVCGGRESHRGVFLKRALGPPILRKYAYRSRFRFRKCASSSPDVPLSRNCALRLASLHTKAASVSAVAHDAGRKLKKMRVVSVRSGSDSAFLCESGGGLRSSQRVFSEMRTPSALGGSDRQLNFPRVGGASRQLHNAHFRKNRGAHFRKWELPEGHPPRLGRIVEVA